MSPCMQSVIERPAIPVLIKYLGTGLCRHGEVRMETTVGHIAITALGRQRIKIRSLRLETSSVSKGQNYIMTRYTGI